jgi:hypothetical protein
MNNYNNIDLIDLEILKSKINTKFYEKLAKILNCTLTVSYDEPKNAIKFSLKSTKFFKKSDINELDITLNSEKLKDFSLKTPRSSEQQNICFANCKYQSEHKLTSNLNLDQCYNINEEEQELYEEEKQNEEISNEIKMKYKIRIDGSTNNNQVPCLNGIDTFVEENNYKKILFKFDEESEINRNFTNSIDAGEMNEINEENAEVHKNAFDNEKGISLIPHFAKSPELQLDFKKLAPIDKKFTEISSQSQLNYIINLIEPKSVNKN